MDKAWNYVGQDGFIFTTQGLTADLKSVHLKVGNCVHQLKFSVLEFELGDTVAGIQHRREEGEATDREEAQQRSRPSQSHYKKGHMTNIYLTDSDKEAIVDFVKDREELYNKTSKYFKAKARREFLWEQFAKSRKL